MTNTLSIYLVALILLALVIDWLVFDSAGALIVARGFVELVQRVAFWR